MLRKGTKNMRPFVIEIRHDWLGWRCRADYTGGRWKYISGLPLPELVDPNLLKFAIMAANPEYIVDYPQERGLDWQDA